jgi:hypothetical protein
MILSCTSSNTSVALMVSGLMEPANMASPKSPSTLLQLLSPHHPRSGSTTGLEMLMRTLFLTIPSYCSCGELTAMCSENTASAPTTATPPPPHSTSCSHLPSCSPHTLSMQPLPPTSQPPNSTMPSPCTPYIHATLAAREATTLSPSGGKKRLV